MIYFTAHHMMSLVDFLVTSNESGGDSELILCKKNASVDFLVADAVQNLRHFGSNTCLNGAP
jgi:hypothetical protein